MFFQIGWVEAEMLSRWHIGTAEQVAESINEHTTLDADADLVTDFSLFLDHNSLTRNVGAVARYLQETQARLHQPLGKFLLHNYLFFRIPLLKPDRFLARTLPFVEGAFINRTFFLITLVAAILGLFLASRQWEAFSNTFLHFFTFEGAALSALTLGVTKTVHELGHAYAAKRLGCRIPSMGVAFMVMVPLLFTDTSAAWRLRRRSQRMQVCGAGIMAETALAAWATLAWSFLPNGSLRSAAFILATTAWIMTLTVNLSPFMRFDGYFLLSDALNVANLQPRAFALARWKMREWLFGLGADKPEQFEPWRETVMILYAFSTWIYRFALFLGIALVVYHMFFKMLGILLFAVEIITFIVGPIYREVKAWFTLLRETGRNRRTTACAAFGALLLCIVFIPWNGDVTAPALLQSQRQVRLFAPVAGQVTKIHAEDARDVPADAPLFELNAPELKHEITMLRQHVADLQWQLSFLLMDRKTAAGVPVAQRERQAALKRLAVLEAQYRQLVIRAPFSGRIVDRASPLAEGEWVSQGTWLCTMADTGLPLVVAYVDERDLHRLQAGAKAKFVPEDPGQPIMELEISHIAHTASRHLSSVPELASPNGGALAAVRASSPVATSLGADNGAWIPEQAVYRVLLRPTGKLTMRAQVLRGSVVITADRQSLFMRFGRYVLAVFLRETGF